MSFLVSPGVHVKEIDLTNVVPAVDTTIGAIAGPFRKGPVSSITEITIPLYGSAQISKSSGPASLFVREKGIKTIEELREKQDEIQGNKRP